MAENTVLQSFWRQVREKKDEIALMEKREGRWEELTWGQLGKAVSSLALSLRERGVKKGDKLVIFSENCVNWTVADLAILLVGGITVPVYASSTKEQAKYIINHCAASWVFLENEEKAAVIGDLEEELSSLEKIVIFQADLSQSSLDKGYLLMAELCQTVFKTEELERLVSESREILPQREATYLYTSGTTGPPKGCVITHENIFYVC